MGLDGKWVELLKANGWQFACLTLACIALIVADRNSWLPVTIDPAFKQVIVIAGFFSFALWAASVGSTLSKWSNSQLAALKRRNAIKAHAKSFEEYIPHMRPRERAIFAQLLHQNRKTFTGAHDGGHAATLIAQSYVRMISAPGQYMSIEDVPFAIPEHIWKVAVERKSEFPFTPDPGGADAWRVHWMAR